MFFFVSLNNQFMIRKDKNMPLKFLYKYQKTTLLCLVTHFDLVSNLKIRKKNAKHRNRIKENKWMVVYMYIQQIRRFLCVCIMLYT